MPLRQPLECLRDAGPGCRVARIGEGEELNEKEGDEGRPHKKRQHGRKGSKRVS